MSRKNNIMLYHGTYFKRGVKNTFEELAAIQLDAVFTNTIQKIVVSKNSSELRGLLKCLILYVESHTQQEKKKSEPSDVLTGTYEEMYSNWRNKVEEAANNNNIFAAYMSMCSMHAMFLEIADEVEIGTFNIMDEYSPDSLEQNIKIFDKYLQKYEEVYKRAGISIKRFADVDEFVANYSSD